MGWVGEWNMGCGWKGPIPKRLVFGTCGCSLLPLVTAGVCHCPTQQAAPTAEVGAVAVSAIRWLERRYLASWGTAEEVT